jgi:hypothetical protein
MKLKPSASNVGHPERSEGSLITSLVTLNGIAQSYVFDCEIPRRLLRLGMTERMRKKPGGK